MDANEFLHIRGKYLEEEFFARQNREQLERIRKKMDSAQTREALAEASGIHNQEVLDDLAKHDMTAQRLAALSLAPLALVAWADGKLDEKERKAIMDVVAEEGLKPGTPSHELLSEWLNHPPAADLFETWREYVVALCDEMEAPARERLKAHVLEGAHKVAEASGGFLGLGSKVSKVEHKVLDDLEAAFS